MPNKAKEETLKLYRGRVARVNDLMRVIASCGRRFFSEASEYQKDKEMVGRISCLEVDDYGRIWFIDSFRGTRVFTDVPSYARWKGFSNGGTMRNIVQEFKNFIRTGKPMGAYFGPFTSWMGSDPWGYGLLSMEKIERAAQRLGIRPSESGYDEDVMSQPAYRWGARKSGDIVVGDLMEKLSKLPKNMPVVVTAPDHNYRTVISSSEVEASDQEDSQYRYGEFCEISDDPSSKRKVFLIN